MLQLALAAAGALGWAAWRALQQAELAAKKSATPAAKPAPVAKPKK